MCDLWHDLTENQPKKKTRSSAVAVIADRTTYDVLSNQFRLQVDDWMLVHLCLSCPVISLIVFNLHCYLWAKNDDDADVDE